MKRPFVWAAAAFVAGTYAGSVGALPGLAIPVLLLLGVMVCAYCFRERAWIRPLVVCGFFFAAGVMTWNAQHVGLRGDPFSRYIAEQHEGIVAIEGTVWDAGLDVPPREYVPLIVNVAQATTRDGETIELPGRVSVTWSKPNMSLFPGDRVHIEGKASLRLSEVNPGIQSPEDFLRRQGVHAKFLPTRPESVVRIATGCWWSPNYLAARLRTDQAERLVKCLPESVLPFVLTVWLGDRSPMPQDEYLAYIHSGTAHVLSVSGLHMTIVFVTFYAALRVFVRNRRIRALLTMAAVFLFALVAGACVASMRAAVMIAMYLTAELFDREPDVPTALSISGILFLVWNPENLYDAGFLLSFVSVASLLIFTPHFERYLLWLPNVLRQSLAASLATQILTLPFALHFFHMLPLAGPLANMAVVPLLTVVLWMCFLTSLTAVLLPPVALLFGGALQPVVWAIETVVKLVGNTPVLRLTLTDPTIVAAVAYFGLIAALTLMARDSGQRRRWGIVAGVCTITMIIFWRPLFLRPEVVFLDVGHGDATFVRTPGGDTLLVDGGDLTERKDYGARVVAPFLWSHGVSRLDYVVVSHPDSDHIGGLFYVLEHMRVGEVLMADDSVAEESERNFIDLCGRRGVPVRRLRQGDTVSLACGQLETLHPPDQWPPASSTNDSSLAVRLSWPGAAILFPGDIESDAERALAQTDCAASILKVPHHGSRTSSSQLFIQAVSPSDCVVSSAGEYGKQRLNPGVIERYRRAGIRVWRTDQDGAVTVTFERGQPLFTAERERRGFVTAGNH